MTQADMAHGTDTSSFSIIPRRGITSARPYYKVAVVNDSLLCGGATDFVAIERPFYGDLDEDVAAGEVVLVRR
jgi:hypothetical protein